MLEENLTTFQLMNESEKKMIVQRLMNVMGANQKSFSVLLHTLELEEERLKSLHIKLPISYP